MTITINDRIRAIREFRANGFPRAAVDRYIRSYREELRDQREDELAQREQAVAYIRTRQRDGRIALYVWERDCDMVERDYVREIPATYMAYRREVERIHNNAEGPVAIRILFPHQAEEFRPSFRDGAMEAFENGNAYAVRGGNPQF